MAEEPWLHEFAAFDKWMNDTGKAELLRTLSSLDLDEKYSEWLRDQVNGPAEVDLSEGLEVALPLHILRADPSQVAGHRPVRINGLRMKARAWFAYKKFVHQVPSPCGCSSCPVPTLLHPEASTHAVVAEPR
jgi:hypothetical protein